MFPNSANDDQVDTTTQADKWLFLQEEFTEENFADTGEY
jgi:phage terminase large subunit-like protein